MNNQIDPTPTDWDSPIMQKRIARRYGAEKRFKYAGVFAVSMSTLFLIFLLFTMIGNGFSGFMQTNAKLEIDLPTLTGGASAQSISDDNADTVLRSLDLEGIIAEAKQQQYGELTKDIDQPLFSSGVDNFLAAQLKSDPDLIEKKSVFRLPVDAAVDTAYKRDGLKSAEILVSKLIDKDVFSTKFNMQFLTGADASDASQAGIWAAFKGSLMTMFITILLAFPVGVLSALYLEEYAPKNRWTDLIEVSINNLAAVPSIIFGLLGLVVFLSWFNMPRSSALVGGLTLALMTMPVIVIAGRNAVKSVPPSIREAALGVGASPVQVVFHHVLPLALPGILTGTIIGMARALGETAPLLLIGMRAFVPAAPSGFSDPSTVLPVQIYLWSDEVNRAFVEKTSAAIIILLLFLMTMNAIAIYLRNRFETRW